jgi:hypothetical protein
MQNRKILVPKLIAEKIYLIVSLVQEYYDIFLAFHSAISFCLSGDQVLHKAKLERLLTLKFQTFENVQVMDI